MLFYAGNVGHPGRVIRFVIVRQQCMYINVWVFLILVLLSSLYMHTLWDVVYMLVCGGPTGTQFGT